MIAKRGMSNGRGESIEDLGSMKGGSDVILRGEYNRLSFLLY